MEIIPNGKIHFLKNIPLDPTYENTIYFENKDAQLQYFNSMVIDDPTYQFYNLDANNYVRITEGKLKVRGVAEVLNTCNYCFFQNSFQFKDWQGIDGNDQTLNFKWIFAFVTNVEYVNMSTAIVTYEVDVMQTFMFDYILGSCIVDRETVANDNADTAASIDPSLYTPEPVTITEFKYGSHHDGESDPLRQCFSEYRTNCAVVWAAVIALPNNTGLGKAWNETGFWWQPNGIGEQMFTNIGFTKSTAATIVNNQTWGIVPYNFDKSATGNAKLSKFLQYIDEEGLGEAVYAITDYPKALGNEIMRFAETAGPGYAWNKPVTINKSEYYHKFFDNYVAKNNKLLMSPYNTLVINTNTNSAEYKYELFVQTNGHINICMCASLDTAAAIGCYPMRYDGTTNNYHEMITTGGFAKGTWVSDFYKNWYAINNEQITNSEMVNLFGTVVDVTGSLAKTAVGLPGGGIISPILRHEEFMVNMANEKITASKQPPHIKGNVHEPSLLSANNEICFHVYNRRIIGADAKIIDNFFTMYGYKCGYLKVPNRNVRPYFTYTKTINCNITANDIPANYLVKIKSIYNDGIRFWKYRAGEVLQVGNYNVDNSPGGVG